MTASEIHLGTTKTWTSHKGFYFSSLKGLSDYGNPFSNSVQVNFELVEECPPFRAFIY